MTGSGGLLQALRAYAFDVTSGAYVGGAVPDAGGAFSINLPAGQYRLWIQPNTPGYFDQWYGGPDFAGAATLDLRTTDQSGISITVPGP